MLHVLISANKGVVSLFSFHFCLLAPQAGEVLAFFTLLLSCGWQNGLLGNLSGQVEERSAASSVAVFPPPVFTFFVYLQNERHGHRSLCLLQGSTHSSHSSFVFLIIYPIWISTSILFETII